MPKSLGAKKFFFLVLALLIIPVDIAILLNIPFLRQIIGFLFLSILPGVLILQVLKLNKLGFTEKVVLSVGLSISFLMLFGLLINNLSLSLGYETPLATIPLLISFNIAFIILLIVGQRINKSQIVSFPNFNLNTSEKTFLVIPVLFPALSIFGMHVMKTTDNNIILMFLLFLIPIYVVFVCFFNQKFPKRLYPVVIFLISISLLLLLSLRSNHIMGCDTHYEYYFFQTTFDNLYWSTVGYATLSACLSISLLPAIYQSILNTSPEFLYKFFYLLIFSISPVVLYVLSKRYIGESYAFLASIFFMSQGFFLYTAANSRTSMAIFFFVLAMMVLFNDKIDPLKKRILFIVFMVSCMVSHYSTTYIFFFVMVGTYIGVEILSKKYTFKKVISLTIVVLFFSLIFFWYSQVTEASFTSGVRFIENTLASLNDMFIKESRSQPIQDIFGEKVTEESTAYKINFFFTWMTFVFIGIGIITLLRRYKEMLFPERDLKKPDFLRNKFEVEYSMIALVCAGILVMIVALPYLTEGYDVTRPYTLAIVILSTFFVIGGIVLSKLFFFKPFKKSFIKNASRKRKPVLKEKHREMFLVKVFTEGKKVVGKAFFFKERFEEKNSSQFRAHLVILLVLIPYFLCVTGVMYAIFGEPRSVMLTSEGKNYDYFYIYDQESYGAKWLKEYREGETKIYTDARQKYLISQGKIPIKLLRYFPVIEPKKVNGYIFLRYYNVVNGKLTWVGWHQYNITEYSDIFGEMSKVYANGGSEVWK